MLVTLYDLLLHAYL